MSFSEYELQLMQARLEKAGRGQFFAAPLPVEQESELREQVIDLCRSKGWAYISARPDRPSGIHKGAHDFTIFADGGRVFCFELKDREGKLSTDQLAWFALLKHNGHDVHVVRALESVLNVINASPLPK